MSTPGRAVVVVRRVLRARPEEVFDEWLDPSALAEFITPAPARSGRIAVDPRVGGRFAIEMVDADGTVDIGGEYLELDRPNRLRFSWRSSLGGGFDSEVSVTLEAHGDAATLMTIEHVRLPDAWRDDHRRGWTAIAGQLEARLAAAESGRGL